MVSVIHPTTVRGWYNVRIGLAYRIHPIRARIVFTILTDLFFPDIFVNHGLGWDPDPSKIRIDSYSIFWTPVYQHTVSRLTDVRLGRGRFGEALSREQQLVAPAIGKARVVPALQLWGRWRLSVSKGCVSFDPGVAKPVHPLAEILPDSHIVWTTK